MCTNQLSYRDNEIQKFVPYEINQKLSIDIVKTTHSSYIPSLSYLQSTIVFGEGVIFKKN